MRAIVLFVAALLPGSAVYADVLVLKNGRKIAGAVSEKDGAYTVKLEGEELVFAKDEVAQWAKKPQDLLGGAAQLVEEAKALYLEAVNMADARAADDKFREALPRVRQARDAYAEARELFPDGYPDLDEGLVNIMKLLRLVRERIGSEIARGGPPPVAPRGKPPAPRPAPPPKPDAPPKPEAPPAVSVTSALAVASSAEKRADKAQRDAARALLDPRESAFASALDAFLLRDDKDSSSTASPRARRGPSTRGRAGS
jgi:hypothetical protein